MGTFKSYLAGFIFSILLTLGAYVIVVNHLLTGWSAVLAIVILALIQLVIQLVFFLHLSHEKSPRWNLVFFISTIGVILIVVVGSIWIMNNLSYHMLSPEQIDHGIFHEEGIYK
jgi:cytochrome o ubiquinol oxidase subunit IV